MPILKQIKQKQRKIPFKIFNFSFCEHIVCVCVWVALVSCERGALVEARKGRMALRLLERKKFCEQFVYLLGGREDTGKVHLRSDDVGIVNVFCFASV